MKRHPLPLSFAWRVCIPLVLLMCVGLFPKAHAAVAPAPKGPSVKTVGTGPYLGLTPQEQAKLARLKAASAAPGTALPRPARARLRQHATIHRGTPNVLTPAELLKAARLPVTPARFALLGMTKAEPMLVPTNGIPELTPQERAKRAMELQTAPQAAPRSGR